MPYSFAEIGYGLYFLGLGLLGGFVGNILASWYNTLGMSKHTDYEKKRRIYTFVIVAAIFTIIGGIIIFIS